MLGGATYSKISSIPCKHDNTFFVEISMRPLLPVIYVSHEKKDTLHESVSSGKVTTFLAYRACLSTCIFKAHIEKHSKRSAVDASRPGNTSTV